jgi:Reverse transcriptase (RNA-dependent DNA polymerase)
MLREIELLEKKRCWELVLRSDVEPNTKILPGRWVYKTKTKDDGSLLYKARWVIRGDLIRRPRIPGGDLDTEETYAPVVDPTTTKVLFAAAAFYGWTILQADAVLAFLNGTLPKPVYMAQPTGFEKGDNATLVCKVLQSLYGLPQSAKIWYDTLSSFLVDMGFRVSEYDAGLWISTRHRNLYLTCHVDDFKIVCATPEDGELVLNEMEKRFEIKSLGRIQRYLGMNVTFPDGKGIKLSQEEYIATLLESYGLEDCNPVRTPINEGFIIDDAPDSAIDLTEYQRGVGSLQYLADRTRPDIARAAILLAEHNTKPTHKCWAALRHALRYLKGTKHKGIIYRRNEGQKLFPICYSDSNWADLLTDRRRSVGGYIFMLAGGPISWKSKKQTCVALSSNEAEFIAASETARQAVWLRRLLIDMELINSPNLPLTLKMDSRGAKSLIENSTITPRSKHIDIRYHYVRNMVSNDVLAVEAIPSHENLADGFTKLLNTELFGKFVTGMGLA